MKPWELLARAQTPDAEEMTLMRRDREHVILAAGKPLMSSRMHGSEEALAALGCRRAQSLRAPCVLVGGLGMGFTLRAALDVLPNAATVVVAELLPEVVAWNREHLGHLAGHPLRDRRVRLDVRDVATTLLESTDRFDAVLLDVDNGPDAFTTSGNDWLYGDRGLAATRAALKPGGVLAVWAVREDQTFERRLRRAGFGVEIERVRARLKKGGPHHTIFLGSRREREHSRSVS